MAGWGYAIILVLDGNRHLLTGTIARMLAIAGLFDVQHTIHPNTPYVPTYKGGENTINSILPDPHSLLVIVDDLGNLETTVCFGGMFPRPP